MLTPPRDDLIQKARAAYADGMKKADILRAINHIWSSTWLDKILEGIEPPGGKRAPARRTASKKARK